MSTAAPIVSGAHLATADEVERYRLDGWWSTNGLVAEVDRHADERPDGVAYLSGDSELTWSEIAIASRSVAATLRSAGLGRDDRVAVLLADGPIVHAVYLGIERAGGVIVGIGPRAGRREIEHILSTTQAVALVAPVRFREHDISQIVTAVGRTSPLRQLIAVEGDGSAMTIGGRSLLAVEPSDSVPCSDLRDPHDLFMLNSTSGTTGMPKIVMHTINRWRAFHRMAVEAGELSSDDVLMSVIPAPYGFGIWTSHATPILLGVPCVVMERFDADTMLAEIERHRVTMLAAVSTQFIMALNAPSLPDRDLSSLRVLFTGGEAVPYDRAARFEEQTGARVLQFFGSNETGALSVTTTRDDTNRRWHSAGRVIEVMNVRLFDDDGADITATGGPGQPGCRGPVTCLGYLGDAAATAELVHPSGWMLTGDIVTIDESGYLRVVGRKSDFVIRGGKNISAPAVEEAVSTVPGVAMVAAVAAPSATFGERVCVYVVADANADISLAAICADLEQREISKEMWPELLVTVEALPMSSGGKVAKAELRDDVRARVLAGELTVD